MVSKDAKCPVLTAQLTVGTIKLYDKEALKLLYHALKPVPLSQKLIRQVIDPTLEKIDAAAF